MRRGERGSMKKVMNLKSLLFCAMLVLALAVNTVSVQADALDYLGNTIDESVLTNEIESVNSCLRKVTNGKGCFINNTALEKVLYLRIKELKEKWGRNKTKNWMTVLNELIILHGERVEKYIKV